MRQTEEPTLGKPHETRHVGRRVLWGIALAVSLPSVLSGCASSSGQVFAWALADQPSATAAYSPAAATQWSSAGVPNTVSRTGVGTYVVTFPKLGDIHGGNIQITAFGPDTIHCKAGIWLPGKVDVVAQVNCFNGGVPADSAFIVSYSADNPASPSEAYTWYATTNPPPSGYSVTPAPLYSSNVTSVYLPTSFVTLSIPTVTSLPLTHVTAAGPGPEQCSFNTTGISCFDVTGTRVDHGFSYVRGLGRINASALRGAYVVFDLPWSWVTAFTPSRQGGSWGAATQSISVNRITTGNYEVVVPGAGGALSVPTLVHVTAYDIQQSQGIPAHCKVVNWRTPAGSGSVVINVACFWLKAGAAGTPADHGFYLSFIAAPRRPVRETRGCLDCR